ncbi:NAD-dependent epimerase [Membranihabitans marinus]|uniref:NAD-dependent epimerase n=1 Tax=Membranihabitans marinus TaxID=1227546 RepID=UPI001F430F67|nr:NAD-dependent epimerase [Membranihabitans marinus]
MKILVTGAAGFIGYHVVLHLLKAGHEVIGLDNINDYYDVELKYDRLKQCGIERPQIIEGQLLPSNLYPNYQFIQIDLSNAPAVNDLFEDTGFDQVCHLAAQAGVRYSLINPSSYIQSNIVGFNNILEASRHHQIQHLVYASSSSVYGLNEKMPLSTADAVNHPISLYAASKKSNELMAHTYSHLFNLPTTGLRFFTVYGPWGRPDMALFLFTKAIIEGKPIQVFNHGAMSRDFTYIDDIVEGIVRLMDAPAQPNKDWDGQHPDPATSSAPYRIYNIGNSQPVQLSKFIDAIEAEIGRKAIKEYTDIQPGDVVSTYADIQPLTDRIQYKPQTSIDRGVHDFVQWYIQYYN